MKKFAVFIILTFLLTAGLFAQQKFALVIGNGAYTNITKLNNPVNDANDMAATLQGLGFTVDKVLNGTLDQMESAAIRLKNRLSASKNSYGFLFYAGHGVQSNGENYLIPVDANIQSESFLRQRAVSVQSMLDELNNAGNDLNVVVLDACRDNPFSWKRSGSRGLSIVSQQPADSIIVYATSAGSTAADGTGRNGLFTGHLLERLKTPGIEVAEVFRLTMGDVIRASGSQQRPAVYNQFSGQAYLGSKPQVATTTVTPQTTPAPSSAAQDRYNKGKLFFEKNDFDSAIKEFNEAIRLYPNYGDAYYYRGYVYGNKNDYDRAIADFNEAIRINPNPAAYCYRGHAYSSKNDYDRATADYNEAIRINPNYSEAYYGRGLVYANKKDYDRAITDFNEAIRLNPNYALAYYNRGVAYFGKKDYDRAITDFTEAIRLFPNYAEAYFYRGVAYHDGKKDYDRAIADYNEVIRLIPNSADVYNNRGLAYHNKKDYDRAIADFETALRLDPNVANTKNNLEAARKAKSGMTTVTPQPQQTYKIGDRGPAGGIVFYDKGKYSDGWRYMEAAPVDMQNTLWSLDDVNVNGTEVGIGSGKRNTELIIAALNRKGESGRAAQLCGAYSLNGYNDWFLPSRDELTQLDKNLKQRLENYSKEGYWSSSQTSGGTAWLLGSNSRLNWVPKQASAPVRAVRAF